VHARHQAGGIRQARENRAGANLLANADGNFLEHAIHSGAHYQCVLLFRLFGG
jgi:hypothetical protein